jgi:hypothetical protein
VVEEPKELPSCRLVEPPPVPEQQHDHSHRLRQGSE